MGGQSKGEIDAMFSEQDHDTMEWVSKRVIKKEVLRARRDTKNDLDATSG